MNIRATVTSTILLSLLTTTPITSFADSNKPTNKQVHKLAHERQASHKFYKKLKALEKRLEEKKKQKDPSYSSLNAPKETVSVNENTNDTNTQVSSCKEVDSCNTCYFPTCSTEEKDLVSLWQPGLAFLKNPSVLNNCLKAICSKDVIFHYSKVKNTVQNELNIQYSVDMTMLPQQVNHRKKESIAKKINRKTPIQTIYAPYLNWDLFNCPGIGSGSIQISYWIIRYWNNSAANLDTLLGLQSSINDFTSRADQFNQFTYTHAFPGNLFTLVAGQYSLYAIDGGNYDNDQMTGFINYTLSQNGSATYSLGSLGAYLQIDPTSTLSFQVGFQDAYNVLAKNITLRYWGKGKFNFYGYGCWSPTCKLGAGQYSFVIYNTRKVPQQLSNSTGWSVNLSQNIGKKLNLFGRANGVSGHALPIQRSFVAGFAIANPCNRNSQDLVGVAASINKINREGSGIVGKMRKEEGIIEGLLTIGMGSYLSFSPDLQIIIHPAGRPDLTSALSYGIRFNASL